MKKLLLLIFFIFFITTAYSEKIFSILSRGIVKDNTTGLIWTRCSLGTDDRPIYDFDCEGTRKRYTWEEAVRACENLKFEGRSDWRLPNIKELQSIVFFYHYTTGSNNISQTVEKVFPGVVSVAELNTFNECIKIQTEAYPDTHSCDYTEINYWSSTLHKNNTEMAWFVNFAAGNTSFGWRTTASEKLTFVRCVAGP